MVNFSIRPATEDNFSLIKGLIQQTRLNPTALDWRRFVVAISGDSDFMGCGQVKPHKDGSLELASIAVRKRYRQLGVASAIIKYLLAAHPRPLYLMCRSGLAPFYEKFCFSTLSIEEMPQYFRRVSKVMGALGVLKLMRETVIVMRLG